MHKLNNSIVKKKESLIRLALETKDIYFSWRINEPCKFYPHGSKNQEVALTGNFSRLSKLAQRAVKDGLIIKKKSTWQRKKRKEEKNDCLCRQFENKCD